MGAVKSALFNQEPFSEEPQCTCPPNQSRMDELCPMCLAEYEAQLVANFEELDDAYFVLVEAKNKGEGL